MSQNVRGLRNEQKRCEIFALHQQQADIICYQEVHCDKAEQDKKVWSQQWGGELYLSHGNKLSRGVLIGFKKELAVNVLKVNTDDCGRYIIIQFEHENTKFVICCLYGPNEDKPQFFLEIFQKMEMYEGHRIFIGDYNVALNSKIDRKSAKGKVSNNGKAAKIINQYIEDSLLTDIWRQRNETQQIFTYQKSKPYYSGSRIDYALVDLGISGWVTKVQITPGYKSDHSAIKMEILVNNQVRGRGLWKLNNRLLVEKEYVMQINKTIQDAIENMKAFSFKDRWEYIKAQCIDETKKYAIRRASIRNLVISQLENIIQKYMEEDPENPLMQKSKSDFEDIVQEKAKGAAFRSKAKWYNEAE